MKNFKKATALILSLAILSLLSFSSIATETTENAIPISTVIEDIKPQAFYSSFTGTVMEISVNKENVKTALVEAKGGAQANFIITDKTYFVDKIEFTVGKEITGFYESGKMMIMIYPPQYSIDIIAGTPENFMTADKFDADLLSADRNLKLNLSEETEIVWENGTQIYWFAKPTLSDIATALGNRKLIVFYNFMTKSIPAQTTPTKIIVLSQQESETIDEVSTSNIIVNGREIETPTAFANDLGVVMVPIRAISEALGYEVSWNGILRSVAIGKDISLKIGQDNYIKSGVAPIILGTAPIIKNQRTYVPLSFFKEILGIYSVYISQGKVFIDGAVNS